MDYKALQVANILLKLVLSTLTFQPTPSMSSFVEGGDFRSLGPTEDNPTTNFKVLEFGCMAVYYPL